MTELTFMYKSKILELIESKKEERVEAIKNAIEEGNPNWNEEQLKAAKEVVEDFSLELREEIKSKKITNDKDGW